MNPTTNLRAMQNAWRSNLVLEATGGDYAYVDALGYYDIEEADVRRVLMQAGVPIAGVVREDLDRIASGMEPAHFLHAIDCADRYRARRRITPAWSVPSGEDMAAAVGMDDALRAAVHELAEAQRELEQHGVSLADYRDGIACRAEQEHFYASEEWDSRARVGRVIGRYRCRRCGRTDEALHVHHWQPIYSAYSRAFMKNFDTGRFSVLCGACHRRFHDTHVRRPWGFEPASRAEKALEREYLRRLNRLHDAAGACLWCCAHVWTGAGAPGTLTGG